MESSDDGLIMRAGYFFFFAFLLINLYSQEYGIISDPDGYTNLRSGPGTNHDVIEKIEEGDKFKYYENDSSNWWSVETIPYFGSPAKGFVHKTRIKNYYPSSTGCTGKLMNQDYDDNSVLNFQFTNKSYSIHGYLLQRYSDQSIKISEFTITDCQKQKMMIFYSAVETYRVNVLPDRLELIELKVFPTGENFEWIESEFESHFLVARSDSLFYQEGDLLLDLSNISKSEVLEFENSIRSYKNKGHFDELYDFMGKLFVSSLKGSKKSEEVLTNLDNFLNFTLDGHYREEYEEYTRILEELK